jgi:hypothetical protein
MTAIYQATHDFEPMRQSIILFSRRLDRCLQGIVPLLG